VVGTKSEFINHNFFKQEMLFMSTICGRYDSLLERGRISTYLGYVQWPLTAVPAGAEYLLRLVEIRGMYRLAGL
jgi:hypothetical protein